jgi:hypothetical protein
MNRAQVRKELSALYEKHGELTSEMVLNEAKNKKSSLNKCFEWDDSRAGHLYRLIQARTLIRSVKIEIAGGRPEKLIHVPVSVGDSGKTGKYVSACVIEADEDAYNRALEAAQKDLDSALRRISQIKKIKQHENVSRFDTASRAIETAKLALVA